VDIEEETLGMDPDLVDDAATARTVGVLPVHVFGKPCRIDDIASVAVRRGWQLIEDACEALGTQRDGRPMGSHGAASVFAFYPNKQVTTGEGGVVVTDDPALAESFQSLRNQGRDRDGTWLRHVQLGFNYRIDELSAAIGVAQLERIAELRTGRDEVVAGYLEALGDKDWVRLPSSGPNESIDWFVYVIRLDPSIDRQRLMQDLENAGVPSRPYFSPLHLQPFYMDALGHRPGDFPVTERVAASTLALPFSPRMSAEDVRYVSDALIEGVSRQFAT
jgi:perosamine synthetase